MFRHITRISISNNNRSSLSSFIQRNSRPTITTAAAATSRLYHVTKPTYNNTNKNENSKTKAPPPRDTRMAGRRRFYKVVNVIEASPPWDHFAEEENDTIDNPISAGVDGTNSATNVSLEKPSRSTMISSLTPTTTSSTINNNNLSWYSITLDNRVMKTPLGLPLSVPSLPLALAIASEWDSQNHTIQPAQMPLMTLVCTTIDQMTLPSIRSSTIDKMISYLKNDTTCYWTDPSEDRILFRKQSIAWKELHDWMENDNVYGLGMKPAVAMGNGEGLIMSRKRKNQNNETKEAGLPHDPQLIVNARAFLNSCDAWTLSAMQNITMEAKSFLVGMAVIRGLQLGRRTTTTATATDSSNGDLVVGPFATDLEKAILACRVEEEFQIENWGLVEGGHDYDRLNCSIQIHAASVLLESIVEATTTTTSNTNA